MQKSLSFDHVSYDGVIRAFLAVRTEGRLCQSNYKNELERDNPSEKRLQFLQSQMKRLITIHQLLQPMLPPDWEEGTDMNYQF